MTDKCKILVLGITLGAVGVALALRLRQVLEARDPETLADRIADDLQSLERRFAHRNP